MFYVLIILMTWSLSSSLKCYTKTRTDEFGMKSTENVSANHTCAITFYFPCPSHSSGKGLGLYSYPMPKAKAKCEFMKNGLECSCVTDLCNLPNETLKYVNNLPSMQYSAKAPYLTCLRGMDDEMSNHKSSNDSSAADNSTVGTDNDTMSTAGDHSGHMGGMTTTEPQIIGGMSFMMPSEQHTDLQAAVTKAAAKQSSMEVKEGTSIPLIVIIIALSCILLILVIIAIVIVVKSHKSSKKKGKQKKKKSKGGTPT
ncbi:hypothetical protein GCK32_004699 [Trichostrongylus colubriformis]|uniref:Uncharacterized protein n=1 Tax=Trichostrongylus colubriformis TaxID=6319 RepID=A0AAN8IT15_TRICO